MTYTALLSLAILRDDFTRLDRPGLLKYLKACQRADGRLEVHYIECNIHLFHEIQLFH